METIAVKPIGMLLLAALIYGLLFPFNKLAAEAGASFFGHAFLQTIGAGVILSVYALMTSNRLRWSWPYSRAYLVIGGFGFGLPMALLTFVAPNLPSGTVALVLALSPTFTYLASVVVRRDRITWLGAVGSSLGLVGVALIVGPKSALPSPDAVGWFLLALITPVMLATANVSAAVLRPPASSSTILGCGIMMGSAVIVLIAAVATDQLYVPSKMSIILPTVSAIAVNAFFVVLFAEIVRLYGPTFFAQFNYLAVVAALSWGFLFFGERPNWYVAIALGLMAIGVIVTEMRDKTPAHAEKPSNGSPNDE